MSQSSAENPVVPKLKLDATDDTEKRLWFLGAAMFDEALAAIDFGVTTERLVNFFERCAKARNAFRRGRLHSLAALRVAQFKHAESNATMAIHLGRTLLVQGQQGEGEDGEAIDVNAAGRRVRDKIAAVADAPETAEDRQGHGGAG